MTQQNGKVLLDVSDLHVRYGKVEALHGGALQVREGQIVTVIGPNGAGKSTLLNAIMAACRAALAPPAMSVIWATA